MAFLGSRIILSVSYDRRADSTLAAYTNPFPGELNKPHKTVKKGGESFKVWFLDGNNKEWEEETIPPMSEGITAYGERLAMIFESGAQQYLKKKGSRGPIDTVLYFKPPGGK